MELDGQLAVVLGTAGAITSAWEELASSLRWLSPLVQRAGTLTRETRASGSASSTRDLLRMLLARWQECHLPGKFQVAARRPTGMAKVGRSESIAGCSMAKKLSGCLSMAGSLSPAVNGRGPSGWSSMVRRSSGWQGMAELSY